MKTTLLFLIFAVLLIVASLMTLAKISKSGQAPGLVQGVLQECPDKPNCVCSERTRDMAHHIDPIELPQAYKDNPMPLLKNIIREMGGEIQTERGNYLAATFVSATFGFVDDLEIRIDPTQQRVQLRSASRVGYSDGGVNRKRGEQLRTRFNAQMIKDSLR